MEEQLQTATDTLKGFEGVDVEELQGKVKQLTDDMETQKTDYENKIAEMKFGTLIDNAISAAGGKNAKAIRALLDVETLKDSKNQTEEITAAIEACKRTMSICLVQTNQSIIQSRRLAEKFREFQRI